MKRSTLINELSSYIDHTLLRPDATPDDVKKLCGEARRYDFKTVCVNSAHVPLCVSELAGTAVGVCSVIGFPLGAMATKVKAAEAIWAVENGAAEIDMVLAIGHLKAGDLDYVKQDIEEVYKATGSAGLKVILETGLLTDQEKKTACKICKEIGVAFVKTSTGFGHGGATVEDVCLMRAVVGDTVGVKASGGVRSFEDAHKMIEAGATRLGTSSGVSLVQGEESAADY